MYAKDYFIRLLKHGYRLLWGKRFLNPECCCDRQVANDMIYALLATGRPCMISRFGTTELNCVNNYLCVHSPKSFIRKCYEYITDYTHTPWWNVDHFRKMSLWSGIFPIGQETAELFSECYLQVIPEIDMLGSFQYYERFMPLRADIQKIQLEMLYPFFVVRPWTRILRGKKVLVVHPFEETIRQQYRLRNLLFDNCEVLPEFELITIKAVQTIAGNQSEFHDWFEALDYMKNQIESIDFDVALLGCGAYGLPLAAYIKRLGKQAVHIGGGLQLLFGIKGRRWTDQYADYLDYRPGIRIGVDYKTLFNSHWSFPLPIDTPKGAEMVENSCYWK